MSVEKFLKERAIESPSTAATRCPTGTIARASRAPSPAAHAGSPFRMLVDINAWSASSATA